MFTDDDEDGSNVAALQQALELAAGGTESKAHSRLGSLDLDRQPPQPSMFSPNGPPRFEPLGPDDVFDVFDLELTFHVGGKEAGIDVRYRSSDSSSARPTFKVQKKTKAHFLGKKNMTVEVSRNLAWDPATATATNNGSKGYTTAFTAKDQSPRNVSLLSTNSVLAHTAVGSVVDVSTSCGSYDPSNAPLRENTAHHFFNLKLNTSCMPDAPSPQQQNSSRKRGGGNHGTATPVPPPTPAHARPYVGGGHFLFDSASHGRTDLLTTLYCTGYDQRPHARPGDIAVAELRVRPASSGNQQPAPAPWMRFFKERHASLHIARRGLEACMTGMHVRMQVPSVETQGRSAVLARGQAMEIVLAVFGTAVLAVEHEGVEHKRWAWLFRPNAGPGLGLGLGAGQGSPSPSTMGMMRRNMKNNSNLPGPLFGLGTSPAPTVAEDPGLATPDPDGEDGHSDDSAQSPSPSSPRFATFEQHRGPPLFPPPPPKGKVYTPSISELTDAHSIGGHGHGHGHGHAYGVGVGMGERGPGEEMAGITDDWVHAEEDPHSAHTHGVPVPIPVPPHIPAAAERPPSRGGLWSRKASFRSDSRCSTREGQQPVNGNGQTKPVNGNGQSSPKPMTPPQPQPQQHQPQPHFKAGSWPEKTPSFLERRVVMERTDSSQSSPNGHHNHQHVPSGMNGANSIQNGGGGPAHLHLGANGNGNGGVAPTNGMNGNVPGSGEGAPPFGRPGPWAEKVQGQGQG